MSIPFGFSPGGNDNDGLAAMFENLGRMLRNSGSENADAVDWLTANQTSRQALNKVGDPQITSDQQSAIESANELAEIWLNDATSFPSLGIPLVPSTRGEWLDKTFDVWKLIVEPVAEGIANAMTSILPQGKDGQELQLPEELLAGLPEEAAASMRELLSSQNLSEILGPIMGMARSMGATMFGNQFGQVLATMSTEVLSFSDVGIPLTETSDPTLVLANINEFSKDLSISSADILIYVALRELAHQRLFAHTPWLRSQALTAIGDYARGVKIDTNKIEVIISQSDPQDLESMQTTLGSELFEGTTSPEQQAALARLELLLALIEGWVTTVVTSAISNRLPSAVALEETFRRRRAAGGPAEKLFSGLVGLELRPRRLREANDLWAGLTRERGIVERDALWLHPDLLPNADDIDNNEGFIAGQTHDLMSDLDKAMETPGPTEDPQQPSAE